MQVMSSKFQTNIYYITNVTFIDIYIYINFTEDYKYKVYIYIFIYISYIQYYC